MGSIAVPNPRSLEEVDEIAKASLGKATLFTINQSFGFKYQSHTGAEYLPLHPDVVKESLSLSGTLYVGSLSLKLFAPLAFDVHEVYGSIPVKEWHDSEKLTLAVKISNNIVQSGFVKSGDFTRLFIELEFSSDSAKFQHLFQLWKAFNKIVVSRNAWQFFNFQTGGLGAYTGSYFAAKLIYLANEVGSSELKIKLASDFPTLFIPQSSYLNNGENCLDLSVEDFGEVLTNWKIYFPIETNLKKSQIEKIIKGFLLPNTLNYSCMWPYKTPQNLELAEQILLL